MNSLSLSLSPLRQSLSRSNMSAYLGLRGYVRGSLVASHTATPNITRQILARRPTSSHSLKNTAYRSPTLFCSLPRFGVLTSKVSPCAPFARHYHSSSSQEGFSVKSAYWLLLGLNIIPFVLWQYARSTRDMNLLNKLQRNATISIESINSGRWWTALTSTFSHQDPFHFIFNMFTAYTFCSILAQVPGMRGFHVLGLTVGSGLAGSGLWYAQQKLKVDGASVFDRSRALHTSALGASGGVMGLAAAATCFFPFQRMFVMPIPFPIPLWLLTIGYGLIDTYRLDSATSRTAHAGHLGGLAFGTLLYAVSLRRLYPSGVQHMIKRFFQRR